MTRAGKSMASCSISASPLRDVCECFWPATQPLCPHPPAYLPAQKEESSVLFLISLSNTCLILPLLHLLCAQHHNNEEKRPAATAQTNSTPKHSTWVWLLDLLQAVSFWAAGAPWPCLPCSPWPHCLVSARHCPTAPISMPHPSQAFR